MANSNVVTQKSGKVGVPNQVKQTIENKRRGPYLDKTYLWINSQPVRCHVCMGKGCRHEMRCVTYTISYVSSRVVFLVKLTSNRGTGKGHCLVVGSK